MKKAKRGPGRPPKGDQKMEKLQVYVSVGAFETLDREAEKSGETHSQLVRWAVDALYGGPKEWKRVQKIAKDESWPIPEVVRRAIRQYEVE